MGNPERSKISTASVESKGPKTNPMGMKTNIQREFKESMTSLMVKITQGKGVY